MSARPNGKRIASAEATLLDTIQRDLYTAVISDALDELEIRHQAMREYVRPLAPDAVYAGWARTILCMDVYYTSEKPYALEIEAIDSILEDEVVVVATIPLSGMRLGGNCFRPLRKREERGVQWWTGSFGTSRKYYRSDFRYTPRV